MKQLYIIDYDGMYSTIRKAPRDRIEGTPAEIDAFETLTAAKAELHDYLNNWIAELQDCKAHIRSLKVSEVEDR